jgi:hypothetical protein
VVAYILVPDFLSCKEWIAALLNGHMAYVVSPVYWNKPPLPMPKYKTAPLSEGSAQVVPIYLYSLPFSTMLYAVKKFKGVT